MKSFEDSSPQTEHRPVASRTPSFSQDRVVQQSEEPSHSQIRKDLYAKQLILDQCRGITDRLEMMEKNFKVLVDECSQPAAAPPKAAYSPIKIPLNP